MSADQCLTADRLLITEDGAEGAEAGLGFQWEEKVRERLHHGADPPAVGPVQSL